VNEKFIDSDSSSEENEEEKDWNLYEDALSVSNNPNTACCNFMREIKKIGDKHLHYIFEGHVVASFLINYCPVCGTKIEQEKIYG
jgi:hypothetical protein